MINDNRKTVYYWTSRQDLMVYCATYFCMTSQQVKKAIEHAQSTFQVRKQKAIDPRDLWQKTGLTIIKGITKRAPCCTCKDSCRYLIDSVCTWSSACPWRDDIRRMT